MSKVLGTNMLRHFTLILFATFWSTVLYAAGAETGGSALMDFVWKVVNVVILVAIIYKFAKKPVGTALNNSAESAKQLIDDARNAEEMIASELSEMRTKISGLEKDAAEMVAAAKKDAELERKRIIEAGQKEIERMKEQAGLVLIQERRKAEDDLRHWIAEESVKLAEEKMKNEINQNQQKKLVKEFVDQLNQPEGVA
ncbi:MAG: ATP synthase F0 subunit B [SAR324 cluster bacterium]|nr:ATP synthase F0 subunit B [SAR324 cluster bacterium]